MALWNLNCQTCKKAKYSEGGMCFACNNRECNYEPFPPNTVSSSTNLDNSYLQVMTEKTLSKEK